MLGIEEEHFQNTSHGKWYGCKFKSGIQEEQAWTKKEQAQIIFYYEPLQEKVSNDVLRK